jgi:mRNA interferase RelE/StbE
VSYSIDFHPNALELWNKLDNSVRIQFKKKLAKIAASPNVVNASLKSDLRGYFKIKLNSTGHRLVYRIDDDNRRIFIVSFGRREGGLAYNLARRNL